MIISVSRRCDIPRFRFDWFMERLHAGFVDVANPFNAAQLRRVCLLPAGENQADAEVFAFWTRDPRSILSRAEELEAGGYRFYVMVTVTGYPASLEPNVPPAETVCAAMGELARKIGAERVIWRYDPVFVSSLTDEAFHLDNFRRLARLLKGSVCRVIISLYDEYQGAKRRVAMLESKGVLQVLPYVEESGRLSDSVSTLLADLAAEARAAGMEMQSCAEENLEPLGIKSGACIDGALIRELWGIETGGKDKNQRPHCCCAPSVDIGSYGNCPAGCVYCYAR